MAPRKPLGWRNAPAANDGGVMANIGKRPSTATEPVVTADRELEDKMIEDEPEFHTDDSAHSDDPDGGVSLGQENQTPPYLPAHLLKPELKSIEAREPVADIPWDQKTPRQKAGSRRSNRQRKKRQYDKIQNGAGGNGVVEAGKAAQIKRGIVTKFSDVEPKVKRVSAKGRVVKQQSSGRQQLLEARQREVGGVKKGAARSSGKG